MLDNAGVKSRCACARFRAIQASMKLVPPIAPIDIAVSALLGADDLIL
jgi:hypothetical protein